MQEYPFVEYTYSMIAEKNPDGPLEKKSGAVNSNTGFFSWRHPRHKQTKCNKQQDNQNFLYLRHYIHTTQIDGKDTLRAAIPNHFALICGHREFAYIPIATP